MYDATVVYIFSDLPSYVRVNKTLPILKELFREVHFIGCTREKLLDESRTPGINYHIADLRLGSGPGTIAGVYNFHRFIRDQLEKIRPQVVMAVNEEYILPFLYGYLKRPRRLVLDLYDSIGMRISGKMSRLNPFWRFLSSWAVSSVDGLVEVTAERLAWHKHLPPHSTVIYNSPPFRDDIIPYSGLPEKFIYVTGMLLDELHGVETILAAVEKTNDYSIVFTGRLNGAFVENVFAKHPRVINLGTVHPDDVLRIYAASQGVWCHYKPVSLNYIYGAPNKLYEAMMLGKPVLINSENRISAFTKQHHFGLVSDFGDLEAVVRNLEFLETPDGARFLAGCSDARAIFREKFAWQRMVSRYETFFQAFGIPETEN